MFGEALCGARGEDLTVRILYELGGRLPQEKSTIMVESVCLQHLQATLSAPVLQQVDVPYDCCIIAMGKNQRPKQSASATMFLEGNRRGIFE